MARFIARRLAVLVGTVVIATALVHVFLASAVEQAPLGDTVRHTPGFLAGFLRGEFGTTDGGGCPPVLPPVLRDPQCGEYGADDIARMMRQRVVVDLQLVVGGVLLALLIGIPAGRMLATRPLAHRSRFARVATAFQLSSAPKAFVMLWRFDSRAR